MNKKLVLLIAALTVGLMISAGAYAATATTTGISMAATTAGANSVRSTPSTTQPNWSSLLPHSDPGIEILRPIPAAEQRFALAEGS
jgi:hypothetical protein